MSETTLGPTCANCIFGRSIGLNEMECRRIPPTGHPIIGMSSLSKQPQLLGKLSIHPPVKPGDWCGEHVRKIETAA